MNDRMYELVNTAFIGTTDGKLSPLNTVENIEKFAESIVKECVERLRFEGRLANIQLIGPPYSTYRFAAMNDAANIIQEHFK